MGNFSRDTFDPTKHYVGVRLQQGVPLVDADWNEQEDIRRFELRSFLRSFVGDGVPKGNDGFKIEALDSPVNDFVIRGGDGTPVGAGRILVGGWEVLNESDILYSDQSLPELEPPAAGERTDSVVLDVWEREVDSDEDLGIKDDRIGIETCVRRKREWVVRVFEDSDDWPGDPPPGHLFYQLAQLARTAEKNSIEGGGIVDCRRRGLAMIPATLAVDESTGYVGIGTNNPQKTLDVNGDLRVRGTATMDGKVGVGIEPEETLDVDGDLRVRGKARLDIAATGTDGKWLQVGDDGGAGGVWIRKGPAEAPLRLVLSDDGGESRIEFQQTGPAADGSRVVESSGSIGLAGEGSDISIMGGKVGVGIEPEETLDVNGDLRVRGKATIAQDVGIGTSDPKARLDIAATGAGGKWLQVGDDGGTAGVWIKKETGGGPLRLVLSDDDGTSRIRFQQTGTAADGSSRVECSSSIGFAGEGSDISIMGGKVGVGTRTPTETLDVDGTLQVKEVATFKQRVETGRLSVLRGGTGKNAGVFNLGKSDNDYWQIVQRTNDGSFRIYRQHATDPGGGGTVEPLLVIDIDGNVGIGAKHPKQQLRVAGSSSSSSVSIYGPAAVAESGTLAFGDPDRSKWFKLVHDTANDLLELKSDQKRIMVFKQNGDVSIGKSDQQIIVFKQNGNVFIGEPTAAHRLSIDDIGWSDGGWRSKKTNSAEYFESSDGSAIAIGTTVTLAQEGKIRPAAEGDDPIGAICNGGTLVGGVYGEWPDKYLRDDFGNPIMEESPEPGPPRPKINPEYDETREYVPREERPEWHCVGLLGQLPVLRGQPVAKSWRKLKDVSDDVELWLVR